MISFDIVLELLRITTLIYEYNESLLITDKTIKEYIDDISNNSEKINNLKISNTRKKMLLDMAKEIPTGKVCLFINDKKTDIQVGITVNDINKRICVIFRGTESKKDWYYDLQVIKHHIKDNIWIHSGFYNQLFDTNVYMKIVTEIKKQLEINPSYSIYITGHSLGAALATLFGYIYSDETTKNINVISFASPRVGNEQWCDSFIKKQNLHHYRITNNHDIVTAFPYYKYKHVGDNIRLSKNNVKFYENYNDNSLFDFTILNCWSVEDHNCEVYYTNLINNKW